MTARRSAIGWILFAGVAAGLAGARVPEGSCADTVVVRGTVAVVRPGSLYLRDARKGSDEGATQDVLLRVDGATAFFNGTRRAAADDVVPGLRVLAHCAREGKTLRATVVRIVGGAPR